MTRKRIALLALLLLVTAIVIRLSFFQGIIAPVRIAGGSMAGSLYGRHYRIKCADCDITFRCDAEFPPATDQAACPNCGCRRNAVDETKLRSGRRVLVDRWPQRLRAARRWERVAFRDERQMLSVKRVVALPGESVRILDGDLYINGQIHRKSLDEMRRMAILVHDDRFRPAELPRRWQSDAPESGWQSVGHGFVFQRDIAGSGRESIDWLSYRHWRCFAGAFPRTEEVHVADNYGYNQAVSRELHRVGDLLLECRIRFLGDGPVWFGIHDGRQLVTIRLDVGTGRMSVQREGTSLAEWSSDLPNLTNAVQLAFGSFDRQILLEMDGRTVLRLPTEEAADAARPSTNRPLRIGSEGPALKVTHLRVLRDIHYLAPHGLPEPWQLDAPLGADEFFLLGDNVPISVDSRQWRLPGVSRKHLLGRILELPPER